MYEIDLNKGKNFFYYSAVTQHTNAGDALINRELIKLMRSKGIVKATVGKMPIHFIEEIGLREEELIASNYFSLLMLSIFDKLKGGNIYIVQTPGDISIKKVKFSDIFKLFIFFTLKIVLNYKFIQVGISLGDFSNMGRKFFLIKSKMMEFLGLRDELSINLAKKNNFKNFGYFPDLSFSIKIKEYSLVKKEKYKICFSFRSDNLNFQQEENLLLSVENALKKIRNKEIEVYLCAQVERDLNIMNKIKTHFSLDSNVFVSNSVNNLSDFYSRMDMVISNRLHVLLLSGLNGCLPIALIDKDVNKKIDGLFKTIGLQNLIFCLENNLDIISLKNNSENLLIKFKENSNEQNSILSEKFENIFKSEGM